MDQLDLLQVYFNLCEKLFLKGPDSRYFRLTGHVVSAGALSCAVLYQKRPQKICTHVDEQHAAFRRSFVYRSEWPAARLLLVPGQASCALGSARCDPSERSFACPWSEMRPLHSVSWALWGSCSSQLPGPLARVRTAENSENIPSQASGACSLQRPPQHPAPESLSAVFSSAAPDTRASRRSGRSVRSASRQHARGSRGSPRPFAPLGVAAPCRPLSSVRKQPSHARRPVCSPLSVGGQLAWRHSCGVVASRSLFLFLFRARPLSVFSM